MMDEKGRKGRREVWFVGTRWFWTDHSRLGAYRARLTWIFFGCFAKPGVLKGGIFGKFQPNWKVGRTHTIGMVVVFTIWILLVGANWRALVWMCSSFTKASWIPYRYPYP